MSTGRKRLFRGFLIAVLMITGCGGPGEKGKNAGKDVPVAPKPTKE